MSAFTVGQIVNYKFGTVQRWRVVAVATSKEDGRGLVSLAMTQRESAPMCVWVNETLLRKMNPERRVYKPAPAPVMLPAFVDMVGQGDLIRAKQGGTLYIIRSANPALVWELKPGQGVMDAPFVEMDLMNGHVLKRYDIVCRGVWTPDAKQARNIESERAADLMDIPLDRLAYIEDGHGGHKLKRVS